MLALFFSSLAFVAAHAGESVTDSDRKVIESIITGQLQAFARDHDAEAYDYAAPVVKFAFPTVETFMAMVRRGYQPVHRNSGHRFAEAGTTPDGRPTQTVILQGMDGKTWEALYTLEQQPDGTWKIAGCVIRLLPGTEA
jgi:hypothetical protein